jgi:hypothetical protein
MMLNLEQIRALAQVTDTTWGKSSSDKKLTSSLQDDVLELRYLAVVQFAGESALSLQLQSQRKYANDVFSEGISKIKEEFKEITGKTLKMKEVTRDDQVELVSATSNSLRKIAYFRANIKLQIS